MKKAVLLICVVLITIHYSIAKTIDSKTAMLVGQNFISTHLTSQNFSKGNNTLSLVYTAANSALGNIASANYFYIFNINQSQGFVIVSADDNVLSVLGYSDQGAFNPNTISVNVSKWLENYKEQIRYVIENNIQATQAVKSDWSNLKNGNQNQIFSKKGNVNPLIQTHWDQMPYYNALCPYDNANNQRTPTGCVATAMAQVMKFWSYPSTGNNFHSYSTANYGTLSANFANTTYNWSSMPNSISSSNSSIATLMFHCGVSVDMNYGIASSGGSGAYVVSSASPVTNCAEYALKTYFGYSSSIQGKLRSNFSDQQWITMFESELDAGRPVIYAGFGSGGGHCFVCDGYDNNNYMHINWGWSGSYDGYFTINALNPGGVGTGGGTGGFNNDQQAVIGIKPPAGTISYDLRLNNTVTPSATSLNYTQSFTVSTDILNNGNATFNGDFCAAIFDTLNNFICFVDSVKNTSLASASNYTNGITFTSKGDFAMLPGTYYIGIYFRVTGGSWSMVSDNNSYTNFVRIKVKNTNTISLYTPMSISPSGNLIAGKSVSVNLNIANSSNTLFEGTYDLSLYTMSGTKAATIQRMTGMTLNASSHYATSLTFSTTNLNVTPGTYLLILEHLPLGGNWQFTGSTASNQNPVVVIVQNAPAPPDKYEPNNTVSQAYNLALNYSGNVASRNTDSSTIHTSNDIDYYKINIDSGYTYVITARLQDSYNSNNGITYTLDAVFSYSTDSSIWSQTYDYVMQNTISASGVGSVYFMVSPYFSGEMGTYRFDVSVTRSPILSSAKDITSFSVPGIIGAATINDTTANISALMAYATNLTSLAPTISVSNFATVSPASGVVQNFTNPVTYTVTAQNGSKKQWTVTLTKQVTGINSVSQNETIKIYPNPSSDFINLDLSNSDTKVLSIKISTIQGQIISEQIITNLIEHISVANLSKGIYVLQLNSDKGILTQKIIIGE